MNNSIKPTTHSRPSLKVIFRRASYLALAMALVIFASCNNNDDGDTPIEPKTLEGNSYLSNQAAVDDFVDENITHITGNLTIGPGLTPGDTDDPITDLSGLINLARVDGDLSIVRNKSLSDLTGLDGLTEVGGNLSISQNEALISAYGLNQLIKINGNLEIRVNPVLTNLQALDGLRGIRNFELSHNNALERVFDLSNEQELNQVSIDNNFSLISLTGLTRTNIRELTIASNESLINLKGLESVTDLNSFTLVYNQNLSSVEGLDNLRSVTNFIHIEFNDALENLDGMNTLESGPYNIRINKNPVLTSIDRFRLSEAPNPEDNWVFIQNNPELTDVNPLKGMTEMNGINLSNNKIANLSALSDLTKASYIQLSAMGALKTLEGLENLSEVQTLFVGGNAQLESLDGLSGLVDMPALMTITDNPLLNDFCSISPLADQVAPDAQIDISFNAYNPSLEDLRNGNCN